MDLEQFIFQEESASLEHKASISDLSSIGHTACAFANQLEGGFFVIGIGSSGEIVGVQKNKMDEYRIYKIKSGKICIQTIWKCSFRSKMNTFFRS